LELAAASFETGAGVQKPGSSFSLIGASRTGISLAWHLVKAGYKPAFVWSRSGDSIQKALNYIKFNRSSVHLSAIPWDCQWIVIAVRDDAIVNVARRLAGIMKSAEGVKVFHTSGAWDSAILKPLHEAGLGTGSFHPLISIPDIATGIKIIPGTVFNCEGQIREDLIRLAVEIGGRGVALRSDQKELVHVAAVFLNNYLTVLVQALKKLACQRDIDSETFHVLLERLPQQALEKAWNQPVADSLSGPAVRGDRKTIQKHRQLLQQSPELRKLYNQFLALTKKLLAE
jgi:predicted short-subunit dehydrogenase-like oxidoreductase (DUF2520 family)